MPPIPVKDSTADIAAFEKAIMSGVKKRQALSQAMDNTLAVKGKSPGVGNGKAKRVRG